MSARHTDYDTLPTEQTSARARHLDTLDERQLVALIHQQDRLALEAVGRAQQAMAEAVTAITAALSQGGRLIYIGAGTSGRLAALDAAECPPTFGIPASRVHAVIAGGVRALHRAVEGAEDSRQEGHRAIQTLALSRHDLVCGISASGVTPFVRAALTAARRRHCRTILITCAPAVLVAQAADQLILLEVGAESIAGSTRMKAGLATKAVLHTLTTAAMIRLGHVYDNLMVDVRPTSRKLRHRAARIVSQLTGLSQHRAAHLLKSAGDSPKVAAVMHHRRVTRQEAQRLLGEVQGRLRLVIGGLDDAP